jgi:hypothetical protein
METRNKKANKITQSSVSLLLNFENGNLSIKRKEFDFKKCLKYKSVEV